MNQEDKRVEKESIELAAANWQLNNWNETYKPIIDLAFFAGANWQKAQQSTPEVSKENLHTEIAGDMEDIFNQYFDLSVCPLKLYTHDGFKHDAMLMLQAAYSLSNARYSKLVAHIEGLKKEYAAEIDLDMLTPKGVEANEVRISLLSNILKETRWK